MIERRSRHQLDDLNPTQDDSRTRGLRQVLNIIFILTAIAGMVLYFQGSALREVATYLLIGAVCVKFIEVTLRIAKI